VSIHFFFACIFLASLAAIVSDRPDTVSNPVGSYYTGVYHNLFADLLGVPDSIVDAHISLTFQQLFYGNDSRERVYYPVEPDVAYIEDVNNKDVRTEGMSYGMMICVQLNKKPEFDRLWKWAKVYMQFQEGPHKGYFAWQCRTDGTVLDPTAASDGEEWFVTSLFFASARWGNGEGIYNYRKEAQIILNTMLHKEAEPGHGAVTNMFDQKEELVTFVPNVDGARFTDPSYQLPHYYELWARWADRDNQFWCEAASASRTLLRKAADSLTGLSPDYSQFDGRPISGRFGGHEDFRFDAWRVAMNVAMDYQWFAKDSWAITETNRLLDFFRAEGVDTYGNQYSLEGKKLGSDHSTGLVAMNAVACLASTREYRKEFVQALWSHPIPSGPYRYYDGMLYLLGRLQVSGNFRIYSPAGMQIVDCPGSR
jgi:oligosaccharide reducing-end xylanase